MLQIEVERSRNSGVLQTYVSTGAHLPGTISRPEYLPSYRWTRWSSSTFHYLSTCSDVCAWLYARLCCTGGNGQRVGKFSTYVPIPTASGRWHTPHHHWTAPDRNTQTANSLSAEALCISSCSSQLFCLTVDWRDLCHWLDALY